MEPGSGVPPPEPSPTRGREKAANPKCRQNHRGSCPRALQLSSDRYLGYFGRQALSRSLDLQFCARLLMTAADVGQSEAHA